MYMERDTHGDFSVTPRVLVLAVMGLVLGCVGAFVALGLLKLINVFTHLFFFQEWGTKTISPAANTLGFAVIAVPVVGAVVVGLMARYGSDRIRGHGIPEALEAILMNGSRLQPRVAFLKPLSAAISIGSGGPFGAEGPIIMTGGAIGSVCAQLFRMTAAERKTLLAAGAAAGMSATFATPVASVLLAVELLLFEWKPRSFIPVALSAAMAAAWSQVLIGPGPLFPIASHGYSGTPQTLAATIGLGLLVGVLASFLTRAVYASEDFFHRLPIHWMWWPAIGGLAIGVGGWLFPQALGVGYDNIRGFLQGDTSWRMIVGVIVVKSVIWSFSLGSGTSGGVLAPLLMVGAAIGALGSHVLPTEGAGFYALVGMGAMLAATMRAPFTGIIFAFELTRDTGVLLPLLFACTTAFAYTALTMKRSILTEKVARRGYHISCEYATDPLEILTVQESMNQLTVQELTIRDAAGPTDASATAEREAAPVAHAREPLRAAVHRMALHGLTRLPVVDDDVDDRVIGVLSLDGVLKARERHLEAELRRERVIALWPPLSA